MNWFERLRYLFRLANAHGIVRRYFVTNGFDGALTMLGLSMGFYTSGGVSAELGFAVCVGAAVALGMSGITSAYISETAERQFELQQLEKAMLSSLDQTAHGEASRWVPVMIALVNGAAPLLISLLIIAPFWLQLLGLDLPLPALESTIVLAFFAIFLIGVFLGKLAGHYWLSAGIKTLLVGIVTALVILVVTP